MVGCVYYGEHCVVGWRGREHLRHLQDRPDRRAAPKLVVGEGGGVQSARGGGAWDRAWSGFRVEGLGCLMVPCQAELRRQPGRVFSEHDYRLIDSGFRNPFV